MSSSTFILVSSDLEDLITVDDSASIISLMKRSHSIMNTNMDITLFHYTSLSTFMFHILPKKQLKLSKIKDSRDPYEYQAFNVDHSIAISNTNDLAFVDYLDKVKKLKFDSQYLCFCMPDHKLTKYSDVRRGYDRPKIWESYGDKHQGVCIAVNKNCLLAEFDKNKLKMLPGYIGHSEVKYKDIVRRPNDLKSISLENYYLERKEFNRTKFLRVFKQAFYFQKDIDYMDENEYRLLYIPSNYKKNEEVPELKIDISNAVTALYFGDRVERELIDYYKEKIKNSFLEIELYQVHWFNGAVKLQNV